VKKRAPAKRPVPVNKRALKRKPTLRKSPVSSRA
jgi:hypothetical protein